jgi:ribosomal protein S20
MKRTLTFVIAAALALSACGGSDDEETPQQQTAAQKACAARTDISKQVETLKGLTPATATTATITSSLAAIRSDLTDFKSAQEDLSKQRKEAFQSANQSFTSEVETIAKTLGRSLALGDAKTALTSAAQQLEASYKKNLAPLDCG